jgi:tRNA modification GTPase
MSGYQLDTITAIATPMGTGGIGIIRLSGDKSLNIIKTLCSCDTLKPRYAHFKTLTHPDTHKKIDEALILYFKAPHSYTGEDVVEIQGHASAYIQKELLGACISLGARLATPGEFTKRAFMQGKLSLTQAESVIDLIHSDSEKTHSVAIHHLSGHLQKKIMTYREQFMQVLEQLEASMDFPDEVDPIDRAALTKSLTILQEEIDKIIDLQDYGEFIKEGLSCLIVGKPNVGKSSIFNAILGKERSIVTDIEGTTRDYIEGVIQLGGIPLKLCDTAGLRESSDTIEYLGMQKIKDLIRKATLILWTLDSSTALNENDHKVYEAIKNKDNIYILLNKSDKETQIDTQSLSHFKVNKILSTTTQDKDSIDRLKAAIYSDFIEKSDTIDLDYICNIRQINCFKGLQNKIKHLLKSLNVAQLDDMLSTEIRHIVEELGELTGDSLTEELLDNIFDRFCIGK